jgi:predicted lactoylglutathione lyase
MSRMTFVNLPVQDLARSTAFFGGLGFSFDERFTDENATCMVVSEQAYVMLLVRPFFASFLTKDVGDPAAAVTCVVALSAESREEVDTLADRALSLGGAAGKAPTDHGFMYGRSFYDPDGHPWELIWMDPGAAGS